MKWPIFGILAVFLLQLGVIGYGSADRYFAADPDVAAIAIPFDELPTVTDRDLETLDPNPPDLVSGPLVAQNTSQAIRTRSSVSRKGVVRTFDTDFRPVTIRVPEPSPYTFAVLEPEPQRTERPKSVAASEFGDVLKPTSARIVEKKKKRSFMAKTFSVIKKPYDWMKAVGSKLK